MSRENRTTFIRVKKDKNYSTIHNGFLRRRDLSWKAKGIMAYILHLPDDWNVVLSEVAKNATEGQSAFDSGWKELKDAGYVKRQPVKHEKTNKILYWETIITESVPEKSHSVENHSVGNHGQDNHKLLSTKELSTNKQSTNNKDHPSAKLTKRFEELWKLYPRKQGKKDALKHYKRAVKEGTTDAEIREGIQSYVGYIEKNNVDKRYVKHGSAWFNQEGWLDDYEIHFEDDESVDDHVEDIFSMLEE